MHGTKRTRSGPDARPEYTYVDPSGAPSNQGGNIGSGYLNYFQNGVAIPPTMFQQMAAANSETSAMPLTPLYVGPSSGMNTQQPAPTGEPSAASESGGAKKKHTSQWALEKRRARNRITAAESRRKGKNESVRLKEEVQRLTSDLKVKTDKLEEYKVRFELYEKGESKENVDRAVALKKLAAAVMDNQPSSGATTTLNV